MTPQTKKSNVVSEIFKKYQIQLKRFIAGWVSSKEDREDILQNVFYQLAKIDLETNPIEQISAWLYVVTRRQIIDRSRKQREVEWPCEPNEEPNTWVADVSRFLTDEADSPEKEYLRSLVWEELETALSELPAEQRLVFEATEIEGFSFKELAETTEIPLATLISRKHYAVLHLRKRLACVYEDLLSD